MNEHTNKYDDIINLPHPTSKKHPRMSVPERAAQFSPFSALTGYEAAVRETARLTEERAEMDENEKSILNDRLRILLEHIKDKPTATITYFCPDEKKTGGKYLSVTGTIRKNDDYNRLIIMNSGEKIPVDDIVEIESALADKLQ